MMILFLIFILSIDFGILSGGRRGELMTSGGIKVFFFGFKTLMRAVLMRAMGGQRLIAFLM